MPNFKIFWFFGGDINYRFLINQMLNIQKTFAYFKCLCIIYYKIYYSFIIGEFI